MHVNHAFQNGNITFKFASEAYEYVSFKTLTGIYLYILKENSPYSA